MARFSARGVPHVFKTGYMNVCLSAWSSPLSTFIFLVVCVLVCASSRNLIIDIYACWLRCDLGAAALADRTIEDSMDEESMAYFVTLLKAPRHCLCSEPSDGNGFELIK